MHVLSYSSVAGVVGTINAAVEVGVVVGVVVAAVIKAEPGMLEVSGFHLAGSVLYLLVVVC